MQNHTAGHWRVFPTLVSGCLSPLLSVGHVLSRIPTEGFQMLCSSSPRYIGKPWAHVHEEHPQLHCCRAVHRHRAHLPAVPVFPKNHRCQGEGGHRLSWAESSPGNKEPQILMGERIWWPFNCFSLLPEAELTKFGTERLCWYLALTRGGALTHLAVRSSGGWPRPRPYPVLTLTFVPCSKVHASHLSVHIYVHIYVRIYPQLHIYVHTVCCLTHLTSLLSHAVNIAGSLTSIKRIPQGWALSGLN